MRSLAPEERRRLAWAAATLDERLRALRASGAEPGDAEGADEAIDRLLRWWTQAFSPGDPQALRARLAWDGLDRETLARVRRPAPGVLVFDEWTAWIDAFLLEAEAAASRPAARALRRQPAQPDDEALPFEALLAPARAVARNALAARRPRGVDALRPGAWRALERQLMKELTTVAAPVLYEAFQRYKTGMGADAARSQTGRVEPGRTGAHYDAFVQDMLSSGWCGVLLEYPVLARLIATMVASWVESTGELAARLHADRAAIAEVFNGGRDPGRVADIEPALSDPHDGRRRVARLEFDDGLRLAYKPREVGVECAFAALVDWLNARGLDPPLRAPRVLRRAGYGWEECIAHDGFSDEAEVRQYYARAGALICLAYVLRARDLHVENLVATREGPVLVDLELLFQPVGGAVTPGARRARGEEPAVPAAGSCLASGLLSCVEFGADGAPYDVGGLRGGSTAPASLPTRRWADVGTDSVHPVDEPTFRLRAQNGVVLDGRRREPEEYARDVLRGFTAAYRFLMDHRDALLGTSGPLARFRHEWVRILPRPSNQYALLTYVLIAPRYLRDGLERSCAIEALARPFAGARSRPAAWEIFEAERRALEALDLPRFTVQAGSTALVSGQRALGSDWFATSGLALVERRVRAMSEDDLARQIELLAGSLAQPERLELLVEPRPSPQAVAGELPDAWCLAHARRLGELLRSRLTFDACGASWPPTFGLPRARDLGRHQLYSGSLGAGLLFAALAGLTGDPAWREAAGEVARGVEEYLRGRAASSAPEDWPLGIASGLGSIVYGLVVMSGLMNEPGLVEVAEQAAGLVTRDVFAAHTCCDLVDGVAGTALALLGLWTATRKDRWRTLASAAAERLVAVAVERPEGLAWPASDGRLYTGLAHGSAGVGYALARVGAATGVDAFHDAARRAFAFTHAWCPPAARRWTLAEDEGEGGGREPGMVAWCHGAPGVALAETLARGLMEEATVVMGSELVDAALAVTATARLHHADHLCCGNLGRVEVLWVLGQRLGRPEVSDAARRLAGAVASRAAEWGHYRLSARGHARVVFDPGFFRGLAGIGYEFLRLAAPERVPSVLAFEVAERSG